MRCAPGYGYQPRAQCMPGNDALNGQKKPAHEERVNPSFGRVEETGRTITNIGFASKFPFAISTMQFSYKPLLRQEHAVETDRAPMPRMAKTAPADQPPNPSARSTPAHLPASASKASSIPFAATKDRLAGLPSTRPTGITSCGNPAWPAMALMASAAS
jgi:hypothetical protein